MSLEWAQASRALQGQSQIGDVAWSRLSGGRFRVAVIDGLGHGHEAAAAAALAERCLAGLVGEDVEASYAALDHALARSRGAAISLADVDLVTGDLAWAGVGNVEGALLRARDPRSERERLLLQSGIVGCRLPRVHSRKLKVEPGDWLIFHTDGVDGLVLRDLSPDWPLQGNADRLLASHARVTDDALIWLGRFHG